MKSMSEPKLHHYVPRALLRRFSTDGVIHVYDKQNGKSWSNSVGNTGAEKHFYTVQMGGVKKNFEYAFQDIDSTYASVINQLLTLTNINELTREEHASLCDVLAVQFLRTNTARLTLKTQTEQIKRAAESFGFEIDSENKDFHMSEEEIKLATIDLISNRDKIRQHFLNRIPILVSGQNFLISDNPITVYNGNKFGSQSIAERGSVINFPISSKVSLSFYCPTIVRELLDGFDKHQHTLPSELEHLPSLVSAFRTGEIAYTGEQDEKLLNYLQVSMSIRFIYSKNCDFSEVEGLIRDDSSLRKPYQLSNVRTGAQEMPRMPHGDWLVVHGANTSFTIEVEKWDDKSGYLDLTFRKPYEIARVRENSPVSLVELVVDKKVRRGMRNVEFREQGNDSEYEIRIGFAEKGLNSILEARNKRKIN